MRKNTQRNFSIFMTAIMLLSLWLPFVPAPQAFAEGSSTTEDSVTADERKVRFTYIREDQTFGDWNIWVWNTDGSDGQIDFASKEGSRAVAEIPIGTNATQMGFVLRSTYDWNTAEKEFGDRFIPLSQNDSITKAFITSGVEQIRIVPDGSAPKIDQGNATFFYRDKELFANDAMDTIEKVELKFNNETIPMTYESENERFVAAYDNIPNGSTPYTYAVTMKDGTTTEVQDPYNPTSEIVFQKSELTVSGTVAPAAIDYNQNAVLSVDVQGLTEGLSISKITADVSALGGSNQLEIDPSLKEITIAVDDNVTAGSKEIPLTVVDSFGNYYNGSTTVEVKTRQAVGENDFDWDESIIYFMLTDRFFDGDTTNNDPYNQNYDAKNDRGTYQGGDFKGITQKLDYLDELGVNTIWISPIVENIKHDVRYDNAEGHSYYAYHGYWASNFGQLNPHFGSMQDFHNLIDAAHERGIKIMVDVVLNHTGYGLKDIDGQVTNPPAGYPTDAERSAFSSLLRQGSNVGSDEVRGELAGLPDFKTEDPAVRNAIIQWQTDWIDKATTSKGNTIDYFRVDTVKHVEDTTWMAFKNAITEKMPEHKMIGETWGASAGNDSGYLESGMMDSLLDFDFKNIAKNFANGQLKAANDALISRNGKIDNSATLGQFLGSHDEDGFLHAVGNDVGKLKIAASLQATAKGQPVIYYGEELGQTGANNYPQYDNRYDLAWDQVEGNNVLSHYKKILNFRSDNSEVFAKGERKSIGGTDADKFMVFARTYGNEAAYVGLNVADTAKEVKLTVDAGAVVTDHYSGQTFTASETGEVVLTIPAKADGGTVLLTAEGGAITAAATAGTGDGGGDGTVEPIPANHVRIHYKRDDNNYENFGAWLWNDVASPSANWPTGATMFEKTDSYGAYIDVELKEGAKNIGFLVMDITKGDAGKDGGDKGFTITSPEINEIFIKQGDDKVYKYEPVDLPANTVRVHYVRDNADYEDFGLWFWGDVTSPPSNWTADAPSFENTDRYGAYVDIQLKESAKEIGMITLNKATQEKDGGDKKFNLLDKYNHVWVKQGDDNVYVSPYWEQATGLVSAEVLNEKTILLGFTLTDGLTPEALAEALAITDADGAEVTIDSVEITGTTSVKITAQFALDKLPLSVTYAGRTVSAASGWRMLDDMYAYEGNDLGATYNNGGATLKLWAPKASKVVANFFNKDNAAENIGSIELTKGDKGVWSADVAPGDLNVTDLEGYFYQYDVTNDGVTRQVLDPYAKSMAAFTVNTEGEAGPDGDTVGKAAIVDLSDTDPEGFSHAKIDGYEKREDAVIYEVHVRDFTSDPSIEGDLNARWGSYKAFEDKLEYIKSLGVTHVQLLPVMAWYYGDETKMGQRELNYSAGGNEYNWGYDPHSYFSPDGAYSLDPTNPEQCVKELKEMIDAIHDAGMGVVLDVVYTHMAKASQLNDIVPDYYAFQDAQGNFLGGFGNNLATSHTMAEKLMVDSVKYWFEEYKIDGMRFDMMGDATYPSVQNAYDAAAAVNPDALFIGEGWRTFAGHIAEPELAGMGADQDWMDKTDDVGVFSDEIRNELKSGFGSEGEPRFITGGARDINTIFNNIKGQPGNTADDDPGDMVQYIAAHDNLPLHDVIAQSIKKDPAVPENELEIHKRIRIGNSIILTSQGTAFLHAGQEYGRTKQWKGEGVPEQKYHELKDAQGKSFGYFIHDSYDSSDAINMFDWQKATNKEEYAVNTTTQAFTKGLIELRKSTNAFRLGEMELVDQNVTLLDIPEIQDTDLVIAYENVSTDNTGNYYVFVNADTQERTLTLGDYNFTGGKVLVDSDEAGVKPVSEKSGFSLSRDKLTMDPLTTIVIKLDRKATESPADNGGTNPNPPAPPAAQKPHTIELPAGAAEVVKEKNPSGMIEVITKVAANKVAEIVNAITADKTNVAVKLEKPAAGEKVKAQLPANLFTEAAKKNKQATVEIVTEDASYTLPVSEVNVADLAKKLGVSASDVQITVSVNVVKPDAKNKLNIKSAIIDFTVEAAAGSKKEEIKEFSTYVEREILGSTNFNASKAVAVKLNEDGTFSAVPTLFDGKKATIKSLTNSTYTIVENDVTFTDVNNGKDWAEQYIEALASKYIIKGKGDGTFGSTQQLTRAEFTALLVRALGLPGEKYDGRYKDVKGNEWFNDNNALMAAIEYGIIQGKGNGTFAPGEKITRTEAAAMIGRAMKLDFINYDLSGLDKTKTLKNFTDAGSIGNWAKADVEAVYQAGIMNGKAKDKFGPAGNTQRNEMAKILANFLEKAKLMSY
ncbi:pullulanase [Bacillus sp. ISL-45]|uniref:pullulanase n=1 Tax=Bacillus sp. ISL-45 TaxID=2819128 RepID=UPI001BECF704|nr:pullulanase [Bacillus sp. ISL-45]MBT2661723.1 pullulanase [Bacillus sp. ISL-45]